MGAFGLRCLVLGCLIGFAPALFAQKVTVRGVPLSVVLVQGQGFDEVQQLALVLWDGQEKILVTGASRDRSTLAQVIALIDAEIHDGDDEQIVISCTRRATSGDGGQTHFPKARNERISSLEVEGYLFQGKSWVP